MSEFSRLEAWEDKLNVCIRCGYCFEHCPIFKITRWETDTPRAKLMMLYGMVHGELEPSEYIAEKLFECFHCKRCEASCSSGVPLTQIFADARADFLDAGYDAVGTTSVTNPGRCARCLACVRMCPHEARTYDAASNSVIVDRIKCQSCGSCFDVCSGQAISLKGFGTHPDELAAAVDTFLAGTPPDAPRAVVFSCNWSTFPGFQVSREDGDHDDPEHRILVTMCTGRLKAQTLLETLERGAWGVLVASCPEDECEHDGSGRARARIAALHQVLAQIGIDERRLRLETVPKGGQAQLQALIDEYVAELRELGPLRKESPA